jgi:hypothetical protein
VGDATINRHQNSGFRSTYPEGYGSPTFSTVEAVERFGHHVPLMEKMSLESRDQPPLGATARSLHLASGPRRRRGRWSRILAPLIASCWISHPSRCRWIDIVPPGQWTSRGRSHAAALRLGFAPSVALEDVMWRGEMTIGWSRHHILGYLILWDSIVSLDFFFARGQPFYFCLETVNSRIQNSFVDCLWLLKSKLYICCGR